jgi:hypothetical protein
LGLLVGLQMLWSWNQTRKVQPMKQKIHARQRVLRVELFFEDSLQIKAV